MEYFFLIIFIINLFVGGFFLTYFFRLKLFFEERVVIGGLFGFISLGFLMLFINHFLVLNFASLILFLFLFNTLFSFNLNKENLSKTKLEIVDLKKRFLEKSWKLFFTNLIFICLIFSYLSSQLLISKEGELYVQPVHSYGDISLHLSIISSFAYGKNFPPENPNLAGTPISYPFLMDYITAIFINPLGLTINQAVATTGVIATMVMIIVLAYFCLKLTKSKLASSILLYLFVFNGGLGFLFLWNNYKESGVNLFSLLMNLPQDYTSIKEIGYWWINVGISMFLPQRAFLIGLPTALIIVRLFWELSENFSRRSLVLATLLTSLLPIIHSHSLIAIAPIISWLALIAVKKDPQKLKLVFFIGVVGMAIAFFLSKSFLSQADDPFGQVKAQIGWIADGQDILWFYLKNFGIALFLIPIALFWGLKNNYKISYLVFISQVWFILPSLVIFQPWDFDNTKLFIYWYLFSMILVALFFSELLRKKKMIISFIVVITIFFICFSGMLDIWRVVTSSGTRYQVYSLPAINMAEFVKESIPEDAIILSADKFDNPAIALAGRKTLVGYHGWLWSYGLDYSDREEITRKVLDGSATEDEFSRYHFDYVILFNQDLGYVINEDYFLNNFDLIYNQDGYKIFKI